MPSWTSPLTQVPGGVGKSADWNADVRDNPLYLYNVLTGVQIQALHFLSTLQVDGAATFGGGISGATVIDGVTVAPAMTGITSIDAMPVPLAWDFWQPAGQTSGVGTTPSFSRTLPSTGTWVLIGMAFSHSTDAGAQTVTWTLTGNSVGPSLTYSIVANGWAAMPLVSVIGPSNSYTATAASTNATVANMTDYLAVAAVRIA